MKYLNKFVKVFDSIAWSKTGDIGDNSYFWRDAYVIDQRYDSQGREVVDVKFTDGTISKGHFTRSLKDSSLEVKNFENSITV